MKKILVYLCVLLCLLFCFTAGLDAGTGYSFTLGRIGNTLLLEYSGVIKQSEFVDYLWKGLKEICLRSLADDCAKWRVCAFSEPLPKQYAVHIEWRRDSDKKVMDDIWSVSIEDWEKCLEGTITEGELMKRLKLEQRYVL